MTTKLEAVLAEGWDETDIIVPMGESALNIETFGPTEAMRLRAAVAVLGKRALAMVLKHEWVEIEENGSAVDVCAECEHYKWDGHDPDCKWGAIVKAAKEIG